MKPSEFIKQKGWCQGEMTDSNGRVCLLRAILCIKDGKEFYTAYKKIGSKTEPSLLAWNDTPGRTVEEVIAILESEGY